MKKIKYSFEQWCYENNREDLLDRWDYNLNGFEPKDISSNSSKKVYFKCLRNSSHESRHSTTSYITSHPQCALKCKTCNSFAQYIIDNYSEDYLNLIWAAKNTATPWDYQQGSKDRIWFNCIDNPNHVYEQAIVSKRDGCGCTICNPRIKKVGFAKEKSVGIIYPESQYVWSDKNDSTPFDYSPYSDSVVWWKCENNKHEDYEKKVRCATEYNFKCAMCANEKRVWPKGKDHPNWKGSASEMILAREGKEGKEWRKRVFQRDGYLCQICLDKTHNKLQAHHFYSFSAYPKLRYNINNGITLCEQCHSNHYKGSFHQIYGTHNNTPEQFEKYANERRKELGINIPFNIYDFMSSIEDDDMEIDDYGLDL